MADIKYDISVSIQNAMQAFDKFSNKVETVNKQFEEISTGINRFATVASAALVGLGVSAAAFADQLTDVANANETTIGSVLGLASALQGAGGNADSVGRMFQTLSNNIDEANGGNLKMVDSFRKLGITIDELGSQSAETIRNDLIKAIAGIEDPTMRSAKAQEIFGKAAMGVDFRQLAADIDEQTAKYSQYESNLRLASDAFGAMESIIKDLKIAATVAFEPLFKYIKDLKPNIDLLVTGIRLLAAALGAAVGASVLAGFAKLITLVKTLTVVARANPIIAIASAVLGVAGAMGVLDTATTSVEESQAGVTKETEKTAEKVKQVKRDQTGLTDVIQKQKDSLSQVTENYNRQLDNIKDKLKFEQESLTLTEKEKRLKQEQNTIEQQTQNALASLKQKYDAMDAATRAARASDYEKERNLILQNSEAAKKDADQRVRGILAYKDQLKDLTSLLGSINDANQTEYEQIARAMVDNSPARERIDLEQKMSALVKLRSKMTEGLKDLNEEEKEQANAAITSATTRFQLLTTEYDKINGSLNSYIDLLVEIGSISPKVAEAIKNSNASSRESIINNAKTLSETSKQLYDESRTFSFGWAKAFNEYSDNAFNAAKQARDVFQTFTSSLEDNLTKSLAKGKLLYKEFLLDIVQQLIRSNIRSLMAQIFGGGGGARLNSTGNFFQSLLGFANGGIIPTNNPVVVGERGPELLVGAAGNRVIPNNQLGGSNVTYNINAVDAMSFKSMLAADPTFLYAVTEQGRRRLPGVA